MKCPVKCVWTNDHGQVDRATGIWFHIPSWSDFSGPKPPNVRYIGMSMEGDGYYPRLKGTAARIACLYPRSCQQGCCRPCCCLRLAVVSGIYGH